MATREERLLTTQRLYDEWADTTDVMDGELASDEDETKLLDSMVDEGAIEPE